MLVVLAGSGEPDRIQRNTSCPAIRIPGQLLEDSLMHARRTGFALGCPSTLWCLDGRDRNRSDTGGSRIRRVARRHLLGGGVS
jgi:hypothetical protein